ncbi:MAG: DUF6916 family protein [Bryobacteraceae bacterium]
MPLEDLTHEHFSHRLNEKFRVSGETPALELELIEVTLLATGAQVPRAPFSLIFRGPRERHLPQRIYILGEQAPTSTEMTPLEIFLVPIGPDSERTGLLYQAIFT